VKTSKPLGVVAAIVSIALSVPLATIAHGEPTPEPTPTESATPVAEPQGSGCDAYKQQVPTGPGSYKGMASQPVGTALANNPMLTTFNAAISGQLNPQVNIVGVLNNGPYVVFAPVDDAFAQLPPEQLNALKTDAAALTSLLYYHVFLGYVGPDDVHGTWTTQEGKPITVTGKGGDIKVNDTAKVTCGGFQSSNARIYMIDKVLDPAAPVQSTTTSAAAT
jgi:uncharacterized surface protein with fasciclin (FAS1) repeats